MTGDEGNKITELTIQVAHSNQLIQTLVESHAELKEDFRKFRDCQIQDEKDISALQIQYKGVINDIAEANDKIKGWNVANSLGAFVALCLSLFLKK